MPVGFARQIDKHSKRTFAFFSHAPTLPVTHYSIHIVSASPTQELGIPTYLGSMSRGLLGKRDRTQLRHERKTALAMSDCVILAGAICDFRLNYGRVLKRGNKCKVIIVHRDGAMLKLVRDGKLFFI